MSVNSSGIVPQGSLANASAGDIVKFTHASYAGVFRLKMTANQIDAYYEPEYRASTFVVENLQTATTAGLVDLYARDTDNPDTPDLFLGTASPASTVEIPLQTNITKNYRVYPVPVAAKNITQTPIDVDNYEAIAIPSTGVTSSLASTTEMLTGTEAAKVVSPDVLAALWEQGSNIASSGTISVGEGGYFNITGTTAITDIDFATDKAGREAWFQFAGALTLTHSSTMVLADAKNITTAAGDIACFRSEGSDTVRLMSYQRAANFPRTQKEVYLEQFGHTNAGFAAALSDISSTPTRLMVTENLTLTAAHSPPVTCKVVPLNGAIITQTGSATTTIANFEDPGEVQCFAGVDASNHIVFAAGAVSEFRPAWYVGKSGGSGANCTYPLTDIISSCTTQEGGVVKVGTGDWHVDNITLPSNITIQGSGGGPWTSGSAGTIFKKYTASAGYIFQYVGLFRNINIKDCVIDTGANTNVYGLYGYNAAGESGFGLNCENVTFSGTGVASPPQFIVDAPTSGGYAYAWEITATFLNCSFIVPENSTGAKCLGFNSLITMIGCRFFVTNGTSSYGVWALEAYQFKMEGCYFAGGPGVAGSAYLNTSTTDRTINTTVSGTTATATSGSFSETDIGAKFGGTVTRYITGLTSSTVATLSASGADWTNTATAIYRWGNTSRALCAIRSDVVNNLVVDNCTFEGFVYDYYHAAPYYIAPISFKDNYFQSRIHFEASVLVNSSGNHYNSLCFSDAVGTGVKIYSIGDSFKKSMVWDNTVELATSKPWGHGHLGGGVISTQLGYLEGSSFQRLGSYTEVIGDDLVLTSPDTALLRIGIGYTDADADGQKLLEFVSLNPYSKTAQYGWSSRRNPTSGFLTWEAMQADPYNAWEFGFPIGYSSATLGTVTQATSRTTGVTCSAEHGLITCSAAANLEPGEIIQFTLTNTLLQNNDWITAHCVSGSSTGLVRAWTAAYGGNVCQVFYKNESTDTADTGTLKIKFILIKGGGLSGVSY